MESIRLEVRSVDFDILNQSPEIISVYKIEVPRGTPRKKFEELFKDPLLQELHLSPFDLKREGKNPTAVAEISFKPGVTDNSGNCVKEALNFMGVKCSFASSSALYLFWDGERDLKLLEERAKNLGNELIQKIVVSTFKDFEKNQRFKDVELPKVELGASCSVETISLDLDEKGLEELSKKRCLALNIEELLFIKNYYQKWEVKESRTEKGLPLEPTDVEVEILAQSWSEHCKHKIFSATIDYREKLEGQGFKKLDNRKINGLYKSFIQRGTKEIEKERNLSWTKSVFTDNAGIVDFDENIDLCFKAETHNSPSALDPYGGALTGILGVNRDILGCGLGAKPIANTDVFCVGFPEKWSTEEEKKGPKGLKHPRQILKGVHQGVADGGNKSGIPTVNGAIYFDDDYAGKPLVFCGTVGAMPKALFDGRATTIKGAKTQDRIFMVGGAIGKDGIHGATFSSLELNESSPVSAVQIGDPLTQKRVTDFLIEARDLGLFNCVTDNGAGGLSSSVGEMAQITGGARLNLSKCPVKYPGLKAYELMISESQERMTFSVGPLKTEAFKKIAQKHGVMATDIGEFNDSGFLEVFFQEERVAFLNLSFIHDLLPPMNLKAIWDGPQARITWFPKNRKQKRPKDFFKEALLKLLSTPNISSKESFVRRYDHEVQAATHIKPFMGKEKDGPSDSACLWLYPHGGEKDNALQVGCGLAPRMSLFDPYLMAQMAVDEALRNVVSHGGDIAHCCLLDNFCWPDPVASKENSEGAYKLGQLVRSTIGLYDAIKVYGTPLVSGKDSMKNDFKGKNKNGDPLKISILPTLLITAFAKSSLHNTVTSDFKKEKDLIYLLGEKSFGLAGSEIFELYTGDQTWEEKGNQLPQINLEKNKTLYRLIFSACGEELLQSCHDLSEGGLGVTLAESSMGGRLGADIDFNEANDNVDFLFSEGPGRFVVSVDPLKKDSFEKHFKNCPFLFLGKVNGEKILKVKSKGKLLFEHTLEELLKHWKKEF